MIEKLEVDQDHVRQLREQFEQDIATHLEQERARVLRTSAKVTTDGREILKSAIEAARKEGMVIEDAEAERMLVKYAEDMRKAVKKPWWRTFLDLLGTFKPC